MKNIKGIKKSLNSYKYIAIDEDSEGAETFAEWYGYEALPSGFYVVPSKDVDIHALANSCNGNPVDYALDGDDIWVMVW